MSTAGGGDVGINAWPSLVLSLVICLPQSISYNWTLQLRMAHMGDNVGTRLLAQHFGSK